MPRLTIEFPEEKYELMEKARLTIEFSDDVSEILEKLAKTDQTTKRDVLRRALALYNHLIEQGVRPGGNRKISITDKDDRILKDIVF